LPPRSEAVLIELNMRWFLFFASAVVIRTYSNAVERTNPVSASTVEIGENKNNISGT
jgi:hypothetical protein